MNINDIQIIVRQELQEAETRIFERIQSDKSSTTGIDTASMSSIPIPKAPLPDNENYAIALELYQEGETHSGVSRKIGVSINAVKKYYNWLVLHGYLPVHNEELSEAEKKVINCIFDQKMSLRETAHQLNCSVTNVVYRRDSALRKGYQPK